MSEIRYCRLCKKEETKEQCAYGPSFWSKYSVENVSKSVRDAAAKQSGIVSDKKEEFEGKTYRQFIEGAAWTKKAGKNSEGGLNEKGRKSYERENPGSDLKAPSKKVGNPRRASFCARMKGMRKRQKPSNNTGEDRLSKSLRKWNC